MNSFHKEFHSLWNKLGDSHAGIPGWRIRGSKYLKFEVVIDEVIELTVKMNTNISLLLPEDF